MDSRELKEKIDLAIKEKRFDDVSTYIDLVPEQLRPRILTLILQNIDLDHQLEISKMQVAHNDQVLELKRSLRDSLMTR